MQKKGAFKEHWKLFSIVGIVLAVALIGMVVAEVNASADNSPISQDSGNVNTGISAAEQQIVTKLVESQKDITENEIKDIDRVNLTELPKEIKIDSVEKNNLAVYEVNYTKDVNGIPENKKVFVLTYTEEEFEKVQEFLDKTSHYLTFTDAIESGEDRFLIIGEVRGSEELGYVMMDEGSITGISTALEIVNTSSGTINAAIYKNGEKTGLENSFDSSVSGVSKDYDLQSEGVITFIPGDVISIKTTSSGGVSWKNIITNLKITTEVKR